MKKFALLAALLLPVLPALAATDTQARAIFDEMLAAQKSGNYDEFVADADDGLKAALSQTQFKASCHLIEKRLTDGYEETFLGELNQRGYQIYLFKLACKDGGDDLLATLSLKDDKVAGILFH